MQTFILKNAKVMTDLNWRDIQICLAITKHGSIKEAAKSLNVSISTVYRRLESFEESLGVQLFERRSKGYELTEVGHRVLTTALPMEKSAVDFTNQLADISEEPLGTLTINAPEGFGVIFCQQIAPFLRKYQKLNIRLMFDAEVINLTQGETDLVVRVTNRPSEHLWGRRLGRLSFQTFGSPEYLEQIQHDINKARWVVMDRRHRETPVGRWEQLNIPAARIALETTSRIVQSHAIINHIGVGVLPSIFAKTFSDALVPIGDSIDSLTLDVWLLAHESRRQSRKITALMRYISELVGEHFSELNER